LQHCRRESITAGGKLVSTIFEKMELSEVRPTFHKYREDYSTGATRRPPAATIRGYKTAKARRSADKVPPDLTAAQTFPDPFCL
jgi:hypothetical protein